MQTEAPDRILRINTVLARTGLSRSAMYRKMENGWRGSAIDAWLRNQMSYDTKRDR